MQRAFLAAHPRIQFHFTPTGVSWLNVVEAWFGILTRKSIRRGSFDTVKALIRHITHYLAHWNEHPTPFVWTKDPADIIQKAVRRGRSHDLADATLATRLSTNDAPDRPETRVRKAT